MPASRLILLGALLGLAAPALAEEAELGTLGPLDPLAPAATQAAGMPLSEITLEGRLLDPKDKLLRFLGLEPGSSFGPDDQKRISEQLSRLGYRVEEQRIGRGTLYLRLEPKRLVRHLTVRGNWPLFDDEILRNLSVQSGAQLPPDTELATFLHAEEQRVLSFLEREGYFGGSVKILPRKGPREEWVDLDLRVKLGDWYKLGGIHAQGNKTLKTDELFGLFDHCCFRWGRFGVQRMRQDARQAEQRLRERGYPAARVSPDFDFGRDADPRTKRIQLPVRVVEKRRIEVKFVGHRALPERELRGHLTIFTTGAYDEVELRKSAQELQRAYQQRGYFESRVSFRRKRVSSEVEEITFFIEEGPELKVRGVDIVPEDGGSLTFPPEELRARAGIETKPFPRLGAVGLGEGGYVTALQLEQDVERLAGWYRSQGFPEVKVRGEVARDPVAFGALGAFGAQLAGELAPKRDLYVRFFIEEGRRERVQAVEVAFVGPHVRSEREVRGVLRLATGDAYTDEGFAEDQLRIVSLYRARGRPYVTIDYAGTTWNQAHDRVSLRYRITEGAPVTFGEIVLRGNFVTRDRVILADLPFRSGDPFDLAKLEQGELNLQTHGIFTGARVQPVGLAERRRTSIPILVTVQERYLSPAGELALGGGIATDKLPNYVYVSAGWIWSNFFGLGSQLELRADTGFNENAWGVSLRYTDLRAFGPGWRFDLTGFWRQELTRRFGPIRTAGFSFGLTRYLTSTLRAFLRYDNYFSQLAVGFFRTEGPNDIALLSDDTHTVKLVSGLIWDKRVGAEGTPNPLMPVRGWLLSGSVGWAFPPASDNAFVRFWSSENHFLVLSTQAMWLQPFRVRQAGFTFIANLRYDHGIPFNSPALPAVERFFGGGDTTTRGYGIDELKTEIVPGDVSPLPGAVAFRVIPQGGNIRLLSTFELQFPIARSFLGLPWPWVGSVFYDAGAIFDAPNLFRFGDLRHSIGISLLRILTPVGPLSFEYAYPLTQTLADERWKTNPWYSHFPGRLHFNWGIPLSRL